MWAIVYIFRTFCIAPVAEVRAVFDELAEWVLPA